MCNDNLLTREMDERLARCKCECECELLAHALALALALLASFLPFFQDDAVCLISTARARHGHDTTGHGTANNVSIV